MTKLFVGGLPYAWTNAELEELFAKFGPIASVFIPTDKSTGKSKGFAFVELEDQVAEEAIQELNGMDVEGRKIGVSVARPKEERPDGGGRSAGGGNFRREGGFQRGGAGGGSSRGGFSRGGGRR